jgi:transcriptional antiterminator NusG
MSVSDDESFNFVKRTPGITNFVSVGNRPVILKDSEVHNILNALDPSRVVKPKKKYSKDMLVRIAEGPFVDYTGKIDDVYDEKERVKVMINLFGRDTPVELDFAQVERI